MPLTIRPLPRLEALLAQDLQLRHRDTVDQAIFLLDAFARGECRNGGGAHYGERKEGKKKKKKGKGKGKEKGMATRRAVCF